MWVTPDDGSTVCGRPAASSAGHSRVESVDDTLRRISEHGGALVDPPYPDSGLGLRPFAVFETGRGAWSAAGWWDGYGRGPPKQAMSYCETALALPFVADGVPGVPA